MGLTDLWGTLVDCICRPPRDIYTVEDLVGGEQSTFWVDMFRGQRRDVVITNKKGQKLQCSHYVPTGAKGRDGQLPCVIYCHCNSGSRRDAEEAVHVLVPLGVSVFTLDFAGSGLSDGQYVTLGANEVDDVEVAVEYLRSTGTVSTLGLWGRSMGAVTALLYSQRDPSIAGVVVDSPFSRLTDLMMEIVEEQKLPIPRPFFKMAVAAMKRSVRKKAGFEIDKVAPIDVVPHSFIPALFGHATNDTFIKIAHSERLHAAYAGDKNLIRFEGDHNSRRPDFFYASVSVFFHNTLQLEQVLQGGDTVPVQMHHSLRHPREGDSAAAMTQQPAAASAPYATAAAAATAQLSVASNTGRERSNLDAWGDQARADITRVMSGADSAALVAEAGEEDIEEVELVRAIQLSLLEAAREQQQGKLQGQASTSGGSAAAGAAAAAAGAGPGAGSAVAHGSSAVTAAPAPSQQMSGTASPLGAAAAASTAGVDPMHAFEPSIASSAREGRDTWDSTLLRSRPATAAEEEAMLAEAIRLSLRESGVPDEGAAAAATPATVQGNATNVAGESIQGLVDAGAAPALEGEDTKRLLSHTKSYVDTLCDELGDGLTAALATSSQTQPPQPDSQKGSG